MTDEERKALEEYVLSEDYFNEFKQLREISDIMPSKDFKECLKLVSKGLREKYSYRYNISTKYNKKTPWWRRWKEKRDAARERKIEQHLSEVTNKDASQINQRLDSIEEAIKNNTPSLPTSVTTEVLLGTSKSTKLIENSKETKSDKESEALAD